MLPFCRLNCGNKSRGGSYTSRERGRVEGNTDGKGKVARAELGVGEVAKGHLRPKPASTLRENETTLFENTGPH
jgi:hypothetical protein